MQNSMASKTNLSGIDFELECVNGAQKTKSTFESYMYTQWKGSFEWLLKLIGKLLAVKNIRLSPFELYIYESCKKLDNFRKKFHQTKSMVPPSQKKIFKTTKIFF